MPDRTRPLSRSWRPLLAALFLGTLLLGAPASRADDAAAATKALFDAVKANDQGKAQISLTQGADLDAVNAFGKTPIDIAVDRGFFDLAHFLLAHRTHLSQDAPEVKKTGPATQAAPLFARPEAQPIPAPTAKPSPIPQATPPAPAPLAGPDPFKPGAPIVPLGPDAASPVLAPQVPLAPPAAKPLATPAPAAAPTATATPAPKTQLPPADAGQEERGFFDSVTDFFSFGKSEEPAQATPPAPAPEVAPPPAKPGADASPALAPTPVVEAVPRAPPAPADTTPPPTAAASLANASDSPPPSSTAPETTAATSPPDAEERSFFQRLADTLSSLRDADTTPEETQALAASSEPPPSEPLPAPSVEATPAVTEAPPVEALSVEPPPVSPTPSVKVARSEDGFFDRVANFFRGEPDEAMPPAPAAASHPAEPAADTTSEAALDRPTPSAAWIHERAAPFDPDRPVTSPALPDPDAVPTPPRAKPPQAPEIAARSPETETKPVLPAPLPIQPALTGVRLTLGNDLHLDQQQAATGPEAGNCLRKHAWRGTYCVVDVDWPEAVAPIFAVRTHLYTGAKAVVRFDGGQATRFHVQFPSEALAGVLAHFTSLYGPPTSRPAPRRVWTGNSRTANPVTRWEVAATDGQTETILEVRKFDDVSGMFPDDQFGFIQLYHPGADRIFRELSPVDLTLLYIAKTRPKAPGPANSQGAEKVLR